MSHSFLYSLLAHLAGFALLWFGLIGVNRQPKTFSEHPTIHIEIEKPHGASSSGGGSRHAVSKHSVALKDLGVSFSAPSEKNNSSYSVEASTHGFDLKQEGKDNKLYRYIYEAIDHHLTYPDELKAKGIAGEITVAARFSKTGEYLEDIGGIQGPSGYLRVLVARVLRKAFETPIPSSSLTSSKSFEADCHFIFAVTEGDSIEALKGKSYRSGEQLMFYRNFPHSVLQWQLGPLSGLGPMPSLNVLWFPEAIGKLFSHKAEIDPLESYRNDPAW